MANKQTATHHGEKNVFGEQGITASLMLRPNLQFFLVDSKSPLLSASDKWRHYFSHTLLTSSITELKRQQKHH